MPLVIINVASIDRLLGDVKYLFETAAQPQINEMIDTGLAGVNNLKGVELGQFESDALPDVLHLINTSIGELREQSNKSPAAYLTRLA